MSKKLADQRVLVIGGSKNLGLAIVKRVTEEGATAIIGARDLELAQSIASSLPRAEAIHLDISDEQSIADAATQLGSVDHIVITAAAHHNVPVSQIEYPRLVAAFDAKIFGPLLVAKHFQPILPPTGSILLFSGVAAWNPEPPYTIMGVSNGAVAFLATHLAKELAPIRVNAISPGIIDSGTWDGLGDSAKQQLLKSAADSNLAGRWGVPDDIADTAVWLLGAGFVSGETIHVEGGARHA